MADTREGLVRVGADVPSVGEAGHCLWAIQRLKLVASAQESRLSPSGDVVL